MDLSNLFQEQQRLLIQVPAQPKRPLMERIDWTQRLNGILGQRGVGKSTLMLQALREQYHLSDSALYISVDAPFFKTLSLQEFATHFEQLGGETLFIDEVHKYADWATHIKAIHDSTHLKIVFSGSSLLHIRAQNADLSRRAIVHQLPNLSFREYLMLSDVDEFPAYSLADILRDHIAIASEIRSRIKPLMHFRDYLSHGCYPFVREGKNSYHHKLINIINQILESDLPYITHVPIAQIDKLKKLLYILSETAPFEPNISKLAGLTGVSRATMNDYLQYLEQASLLNRVPTAARGTGKMRKPEKIYLANTNLSCAINSAPNTGTSRETFFVNQIKNSFCSGTQFLDRSITLAATGDFVIDEQHTIEVGGKNKGQEQIRNLENAFLAVDDIEIGFKNRVPLWLFGFLT